MMVKRNNVQSPKLDKQSQSNRNLLIDAIDGFVGGVALYDRTGALVVANECYETFFPELVSMHMGDLFEDQLKQRVAVNAIPDAIGQEDEWLAERMDCFFNPAPTSRDVLYPDGRWIRAREQRVSNGILRTLLDVTSTQNLKLRMEANSRRFEDFSTCAADVFWETDAQLLYTYLTGSVEELLGSPASAFIGEDMTLLSPNVVTSNFTANSGREPSPWLNQKRFHQIKIGFLMLDSSHKVLTCSGMPMCDNAGKFTGYRGTLADVTETDKPRIANRECTHDELTGLPNRRSFDVELQLALTDTRASEVIHTLCYFDIDHFRLFIDNSNPKTGDIMIQQVSSIMQQHARPGDVLARLDIDVFGLLLRHCSLSRGHVLATQICEAVSHLCVDWKETACQVEISAGLVEINCETESPIDAMNSADVACHSAKVQCNEPIYIYRDKEDVLLKERADSIQKSRIQQALTKPRHLRIHYQPIISTSNVQALPAHYEVLLRLFDEQGEMSLPGLFIATAEQHNLMNQIDRWVVQHAFRCISQHRKNHVQLHYSINISEQTLADSTFAHYVATQFDATNCDPTKICFELDESIAVRNHRSARLFMNSMRTMGCQLALDNFGSDHFSIAQLQKLPISYLKIDGNLINNILSSDVNKIILQSICNISNSLNINVIAEHVNDDNTIDLLSDLGVNYVQSYHTGIPSANILN